MANQDYSTGQQVDQETRPDEWTQHTQPVSRLEEEMQASQFEYEQTSQPAQEQFGQPEDVSIQDGDVLDELESEDEQPLHPQEETDML